MAKCNWIQAALRASCGYSKICEARCAAPCRSVRFSEIWIDAERFDALFGLKNPPDVAFLGRINPLMKLRKADDPLAALLALDPAIFGWILGTDEMQMPTLEALTLVGENVGSFTVPLKDYPVGVTVEPIGFVKPMAVMKQIIHWLHRAIGKHYRYCRRP